MPNETTKKSTNRLLRLIKSRERALDQVRLTGERIDSAMADISRAGGKAHAIPYPVVPEQRGLWRLWIITSEGYYYDWVKKPAEPLNLEIGQRLYAADRRLYTVCPRLRKINKAIAEELGFEFTNHENLK